MAVWMEFRCEKRATDGFEGCWSHQNAGPMDMAYADTNEAVLDNLRDLRRWARQGGWTLTRDGWVCPTYSATMNAPTPPSTGAEK